MLITGAFVWLATSSQDAAPFAPSACFHRQFAVEASLPPATYIDDFLAAATLANMSLDPPTYLASLQSNIRQRPIPWEGAVRAGTLTEDQHATIRAVDKAKNPEQKKQIVEGDLDGYRLLLVGGDGKPSVLETASKQPNVIQYILVLLADLLEGTASPLPPRKLHCSFQGSCAAQPSLPKQCSKPVIIHPSRTSRLT